MRKLFLPIFFVLMLNSGFTQNNGFGAAALYNIQTKSYGADVRFYKNFKRFALVPQITYYFPFSKIHEFYAGINVHYNVFNLKKYNTYLIGGIAYNGWINYENSPMSDPSFSNIAIEVGGGISTKKCIAPFIEYRYNARWMEANVRLGFIYTFNCKRRGSSVPCPAY